MALRCKVHRWHLRRTDGLTARSCHVRSHGAYPLAINIIRRRVVQDLALAFTLDEAIVEDVLGPPEMLHAGCNPDLDMNLNLFPDMEWVPRDVQVSGVHLWSTIPDVISQALYRSLEERMSDFRGPDGHAYDSRFQGQGQGLREDNAQGYHASDSLNNSQNHLSIARGLGGEHIRALM